MASTKINIHQVQEITIGTEQVRGEEDCPDHDWINLLIGTDDGETEITLFGSPGFAKHYEHLTKEPEGDDDA